MKLISFVIPSYNSSAYLHRCVDSLLIEENDIEIIIVNDGSIDNTIQIADAYQSKYPNQIIVIDQENGGHGEGINAGLQIASGKYFKVVDSDDWLDRNALTTMLDVMRKNNQNDIEPDVYFTNFVYERAGDNAFYVRDYRENFPANKLFTWHDVKKPFKYSKTLLMHAIIYRTSILKESKIELPKHTFYVDNLFAYQPLPYTKSLFYMPMPLYRYFIGRDDQSITMENIINRYQQQIRVMKIMLESYSYDFIDSQPIKLKKYMKHCLNAIMAITQMFTTGSDSPERRNDLKKLWHDLKTNDIKMYRFLKYRSYNTLVNFLPWKIKGYIMTKSYLHLRKTLKLG